MDNGRKAEQKNEGGKAAFQLESAFRQDDGRKPNGKIDSIEIMMKSDVVCSNPNRVAIIHLLKKNPRREMQAEKLAQALGVSHRTALYHLDILEDYELVKVSGFRRKGKKMLRSVWGLNMENGHVEKILSLIYKKFPPEKVRKIIKENGYTNGYNRKVPAPPN